MLLDCTVCRLIKQPETAGDYAQRTGAGSTWRASRPGPRTGDYFLLNGQKIWTSAAQYADWTYLLARTDANAPSIWGSAICYSI